MANVVVCPNCQASLRYGQAPPQRKQVGCPRCGHTLVIPSAMEELSLVTPTAAKPEAGPLAAPPAPQPAAPPTAPAWPEPVALPPVPGVQDFAPPPRARSDAPRRDDGSEASARRRPAPYDDYGADDFGDFQHAPRKRSNKGLLIGLLIGGGLVLVGGVVVLLVVLLGGGNPLVGRWRPLDAPGGDAMTIEFTSSGEVVVVGMGRTERARYRILDAGTLEIETGGFGAGGGPDGGAGRKEVASFRIERDELVITPTRGPVMRLRRM